MTSATARPMAEPPPPERPPAGSPQARSRRMPRWVMVVATVAVVALVARYVLVPQFTADRSAFLALGHVALPLLAIATFLEIGSLLAYSLLTAVILGRPRPSYWTLLRVDIADLGINHTVPGGGTTSGAVRMRLFERLGIPVSDGVIAATVEILGSNVVLGAVFAVGIVLSLTSFATNGYYLTAGVAVLVVLAASGLGGWLLVARTEAAARVSGVVVGFRRKARAEAFVRSMAATLRRFGGDRRRLSAAVVLALANWLLDAAALAVVFAAFGQLPPLGVLLAVYGLGSILMMVPLTPGGIGLVEGVMVPAFVAFGVPAAPALLGVLGWRVLQYWMPIPAALAAYVSLRLGPLRPKRARPGTGSVRSGCYAAVRRPRRSG